MHYGAHPLGRGTPQELTQALGEGAAKVCPMNPGDKVEF
jgi:hypothetical protein